MSTDEYPIEVPAFTRTVAAGIIGRQLIAGPVLGKVLGTEFKQLREEFNIEVQLVAAAQRDAQGGRMLLRVRSCPCTFASACVQKTTSLVFESCARTRLLAFSLARLHHAPSYPIIASSPRVSFSWCSWAHLILV